MEGLHTRLTVVFWLVLLSSTASACQGAYPRGPKLGNGDGWPQTRAERTDYRETSHYEDVLQYLEDLQVKGAPISVQFIGVSTQGRKIPLVIAARPPVAGPADAHRIGKPIVYVQANIHAGEVEGKEAVLILLRELAQKPKGGLLDKIVMLTTPIYNIDGNETWGPWQRNRRNQNDPEVVGIRANGQGLDLNRDAMKAESPEMRAALQSIYTTWDPDVVVDLHATNGTRHGFQLTYSPPLHPDTESGLLRFNRDELLPAVRRHMRQDFGIETFVYGNLPRNGKSQGWYQSAPNPRRITNYVGLRNRLSVLSEAACYLPFRQRVLATHHFVLTVLEEVGRQR
ncbi:MAG: M14 family metallopeptidase, partial [Desulfobacteraceae bacterium]|nr:M14 family metallopeptidase [Desulfobacteraceae bacterium]